VKPRRGVSLRSDDGIRGFGLSVLPPGSGGQGVVADPLIHQTLDEPGPQAVGRRWRESGTAAAFFACRRRRDVNEIGPWMAGAHSMSWYREPFCPGWSPVSTRGAEIPCRQCARMSDQPDLQADCATPADRIGRSGCVVKSAS